MNKLLLALFVIGTIVFCVALFIGFKQGQTLK